MRYKPALCYGLAAIPFVGLVLFVVRFGVDVPYRDEWTLVWYLKKIYQGSLSLHDLWLPLNEHRMLFPRIILLPLVMLTKWNTGYEMAVSILFAAGTLALIIYQTERTKASLGLAGTSFLIPALALLVFSLKQSENWLMGFQLGFFLNVLAVVSGIVLLAMPVFKWWRFLAALLLGVVAGYSTANGLLYWLVALPVLFGLPFEHRRTKPIVLILWLFTALATIGSYFCDYRPSGGMSAPFFITHPLAFVTYVLCYLGNPVGPNHILATALAGLLGLLLIGAASYRLIRTQRLTLRALAPYLALAFYSIGSALLTGAGRADLGALQAKVSRYVTYANLLWIVVFILLYLVFATSRDESSKPGGRDRKHRVWAGVSLGLFIGIVLATVRSSVKEIPVYRDWQSRLRPAQAELRSGKNPELLREIYPWDINLPVREIPFLKQHHLSVFRKQ